MFCFSLRVGLVPNPTLYNIDARQVCLVVENLIAILGDSKKYIVKLNVEAIGPVAFYVEWSLQSPDANANVYYYVVYSSRLTNQVKFTSGNNLTLTDLIECTTYTITVICSLIGANNGNNSTLGSPYASANATTSHDSRK